MTDTTVKKIDSSHSPKGPMGQRYLASGTKLSMRLWEEGPTDEKAPTSRDYETVGYVLEGEAELISEGQTVRLTPGDSWVVPRGAEHTYRILSDFRALEATSPPAHAEGRDRAP
ncbi:MAG: cupin domain-containing protein [Thermoanaerobaculia bacterium]|nr:cupin domain-containing protein [Thermoanaerobaculia bacterium]